LWNGETMKSLLFAWRRAILMAGLLTATIGFVLAQAQHPVASTQTSQHVLIHMKEYVAGIHETYMGLELADRLERDGAKVTVWLELQAVRLADDRVVRGLDPKPGARSFSEIYKSFIEHGGRVLVCHHCAGLQGVDQAHLRAGAKFVGVNDVARAVLDADKILDY